jgi:hypothetical protein
LKRKKTPCFSAWRMPERGSHGGDLMSFPVMQNAQGQWHQGLWITTPLRKLERVSEKMGLMAYSQRELLTTYQNIITWPPEIGNIWLTLVLRPHDISCGQQNS